MIRKINHRIPEQGFSLVELMVALVIGLLITLGATQLFITGKQAFYKTEQMGKRQETLRYLVDVISQDVRMADRLSNDVVLDGGMELTYANTRDDDPYCGGTSDLTSLEYYQEGSTIKVRVFCNDELASDQGVVKGVEEASFILSPENIEDTPFKVYVDIVFSLEPIDGFPDEIAFRVTNRRSAVARLE